MENCNSIAEIDVAVLVSNIKLSDTDFANAPYVSILDLDLNLDIDIDKSQTQNF